MASVEDDDVVEELAADAASVVGPAFRGVRGVRGHSTVVAIVIAMATRLSPAIRPEATGTV